MGALTKKEREGLEDVFMSIHSKNRTEQLRAYKQHLKFKTLKGFKLSIKKIKKGTFTLYTLVINKLNH